MQTVRVIAALCLTCSMSLLAVPAHGQLLKEDLPAAAQSINVEDNVGEFIPLDVLFTDERGNKVTLGKFFNKKKPIVLTLNYSDCPGLCIAQLDNLVSTLRGFNAKGLGDDFEIVTVSIDPREDYMKAAETKTKYTGLLRNSSADKSWHFLTGKSADIRRLANAVGFRYSYDKVNKRYNHPAVTYFVSPEGRICRYLLSLGVEPQQFQLAVAEANEGKLTLSLSDALVQFCFLYDPNANRYTASARRILAFAGAAFVLLLIATTAPFWFSGKKDARNQATGSAKQSPTESGSAQEGSGETDFDSSTATAYNNVGAASKDQDSNLVTGTTE